MDDGSVFHDGLCDFCGGTHRFLDGLGDSCDLLRGGLLNRLSGLYRQAVPDGLGLLNRLRLRHALDLLDDGLTLDLLNRLRPRVCLCHRLRCGRRLRLNGRRRRWFCRRRRRLHDRHVPLEGWGGRGWYFREQRDG